ncbi:MAG TPA: hypothetical protein VGO55_00160 [Allosphingosinicella sp.]|jgi:hypothetical protein|nr:hypothetical protein [Allosphingosinicella sp.]
MRRPILLAACLLCLGATAARVLAAVPVAVLGRSNDPWEGDPAQNPRTRRQCDNSYDWVEKSNCRQITGAAVAVRRLERAPVIPLTDGEAAVLLGLGSNRSGAAAGLFDAWMAGQRAIRARVIEQGHGSWSLADQRDLDALLAIRNGPRLRDFRPYLVRGLTDGRLRGDFSMQICGTTLVVMHMATGRMHLPPDRAAFVVFLGQAPDEAFISWAVGGPEQSD